MKKVLIIAYYYYPFEGVGAKRASYWGKNIEIVANDIECTIITATEQNEEPSYEEVIVIKPTLKRSLLGLFIKDEGLSWLKSLRKHFKDFNDKKYDTVIITGGPFFHFFITGFLKRVFNCKVIIDFRDPFSLNPRYNNNIIIKTIKKVIEFHFVKNADIVITVNEYCKRLITGNIYYENKFKIIENGFDESLVEDVKKTKLNIEDRTEVLKMVHAGTIYDDINPQNFIDVVTRSEFSNKLEFIHAGKEKEMIQGDNVKRLGVIPYKETLQIINYSDICLIFTGGIEAESTTKIFDYIAFNKTILVITNGEKEAGNINEILKNIPNVYWAYNELADIYDVLKIIIDKEENDKREYSTYQFSRLNGLNKIIKIIRTL